MIRILICAIATCIATVAGAMGVMSWKHAATSQSSAEDSTKLVTAKTRMISVPVIVDNEVKGYVVVRFEFIANADLIKASHVEIESVVADEAFKVIYGDSARDFRNVRKTDVLGVTKSVREGVNKRLAAEVIKDVLIDSWSYLRNREAAKANG